MHLLFHHAQRWSCAKYRTLVFPYYFETYKFVSLKETYPKNMVPPSWVKLQNKTLPNMKCGSCFNMGRFAI
jgi:hypothetical protein